MLVVSQILYCNFATISVTIFISNLHISHTFYHNTLSFIQRCENSICFLAPLCSRSALRYISAVSPNAIISKHDLFTAIKTQQLFVFFIIHMHRPNACNADDRQFSLYVKILYTLVYTYTNKYMCLINEYKVIENTTSHTTN